MGKMVNFMLRVFTHNKKKKNYAKWQIIFK